MKKFAYLVLICLLLSGCSSGSKAAGGQETVLMEAEDTAVGAGNSAAASGLASDMGSGMVSETEMREVIASLEQFESGLLFQDMEPELAASYGRPLGDSYEFVGRITEDGIGYVLGFKRVENSLLDGLSISGVDDHIEAAVWDEQNEEYKPVYTFDRISGLRQGSMDLETVNQVLYLQPLDLAEPEEIEDAFWFQYCGGVQGAEYARDVLDRGVRFSPPDNGAYLAVTRYENGKQRFEYAALTEEEEREILKSDQVVSPELYGYSGLEFFVSQETYEQTDRENGEITMPALEIAGKRCRFETAELSEIHDIVKVEMELYSPYGDEKDSPVREYELTEPEKIRELSEILSSSEFTGEGKCPYTGVLTLTRNDGMKITVSLATDSCDGFTIGSYSFFSPGKEKTARIWEMFPEAREYTGWAVNIEAETVEQGNTAGPGGTGE